MGILIDREDFVGKHKLTKTIDSSLESCITDHESSYLIKLLGLELYNLFIADLTSQVPVTQRFLDIFNKIEIQEPCLMINTGMKNMLLGFLWFEYARENKYIHTGTGVQHASTNDSETPDFTNELAYKQYNDAVRGYKVIQQYILKNSSTYPEFKGINLELASLTW